jgi:hypothetical protein
MFVTLIGNKARLAATFPIPVRMVVDGLTTGKPEVEELAKGI